MSLALHFTGCIYIAVNNCREKHTSEFVFGDMYVSHVRSEHCDWSTCTEKMRQLDLCGFNLSVPINFTCKFSKNIVLHVHVQQFYI